MAPWWAAPGSIAGPFGAFPAPVVGLRPAKAPKARPVIRRRATGKYDRESFMQRKEFDLLSGQEFRNDAIVQYSNTNQSEPLRVYLSLFFAFASFSAPTFFPNNAGPEYFVPALLVGLASGAFFLRENGKRTKQLERLQREYSIGDLSVEITDPATQLESRRTVARLRGQRRLVALYGTKAQLVEALNSASPYRKALAKSKALVIPIADGDAGEAREAAEAALGGVRGVRLASSWLGAAAEAPRWRSYFEELLGERAGARGTWVALNFRGRVLGSNFGSPIWDELLAALPPEQALLSTEGPAEDAPKELLQKQAEFFDALIGGDRAAMEALFLPEDDAELSFVLETDGAKSNLSDWGKVLADGARPEIFVASQDAVLVRPGEAVTTAIELPVLGPTLLATQIWRKVPDETGGKAVWKLLKHRTIPYAPRVEARVALRCDHRGCIAFGKQLDAMR